MARRPRLVVPGQALHLIQRGNNRAVTFIAPRDYFHFREILRESSERTRCAIHAYVLMGNHVHLLVTPADEGGPGRMMQSLGRRYVRYFNDVYGRTGTLWEGRFRSAVVDSGHYFLACSRYIELNPVRAGIVDHPGKYPWSSFPHNAEGAADPLLTAHPVYRRLGGRIAERRSAYRALFEWQLGADALETIRRATNAGTVLGTERFREQIATALRRVRSPLGCRGARPSAAIPNSRAS